ncbi:hypothetical protein ACROYT_G016473 [Oculina patagonica]
MHPNVFRFSGGFYSDDLGYVSTSCKKCPTGSFVPFDKTPGKLPQDCKACPEGTETDFFAGHRACKCLKGFYRTHLFEKCHKCGTGGLECNNDSASLKPGYWWRWRNGTYKNRYRDFIKNLFEAQPSSDAYLVQYPYPIPKPYKCPREESCKGGLDSPCENGYEGPLCGVCSSRYYKKMHTCNQCPPKRWIVGQLLIITVVLLIIMAALVWMSKRKIKKTQGLSLIDIVLSKLKIVIGFYQVTYGLVEAFSYIKWPDSLEVIAKYSEILQLNILQITPLHCLIPGSHVDAFGSLFAMMAINFAVIGLFGIAYAVHKVIILKKPCLEDEEKSRKISETKELVYRNLFFFLYVTYLSTFSKTASVLPLACQKLCRDEREELCNEYLKADYSIQCHGPRYRYLLIGAYFSTAYIVALPAASFIALWKQRKLILATKCHRSSNEMITGLRFLFENYKTRSWYWELVEMSRKVILTSGLILVGQESRSYIGLALVIAGMYGMLFCWIRPIQDEFDNRLMSASLAVTVVNLAVGAVSRIPAENIAASRPSYMDEVLFKILVLGANTLVIGLLVVQYGVSLYRYLKEWRKNPHWSFSCCLAFLLPLKDFEGEMFALAESDEQKIQLDTGETEMPTILSAVKDSGAVDVTLGEDQQGVDEPVVLRNANCKDSKKNKSKCHKAIQTESVSLFTMTDATIKEAVEDTQF